MRTFFITGLPRCRSAWFANYLTFGQSICLHDGFCGLKHWGELREKLESLPCQSAGNSDPANVFYWRTLREWYPDAVWIVIVRPFAETLASCRKFVPVDEDALLAMSVELEALRAETGAVSFDFHQINSAVALEIAARCGVDAGPAIRTETLLRMNVQADPAWLAAQLARRQ